MSLAAVGLLRDITLALAREGGLDDSQQESLAHTGLQNALDTWVALLQGTDGGAPTALTEAAGEVFCTLVDQKAREKCFVALISCHGPHHGLHAACEGVRLT